MLILSYLYVTVCNVQVHLNTSREILRMKNKSAHGLNICAVCVVDDLHQVSVSVIMQQNWVKFRITAT